MRDVTRRRVLGSLAGLTTLTAGCVDAVLPEDPGEPTADPFPEGRREPTTRTVRHPGGDRAVSSPMVETGDDRGVGVPSQWLVNSAKDRETLSFAPDAVGVPAAERLLDGTDLSAATVYVVQREVPACRTLTVTAVRWGETGVAVRWRDIERDADCDPRGPPAVEALFITVPGVVRDLDVTRFTPIRETTMPL